GLPQAWRGIPLKLFLAHQSGIPEIESARQPTFQEELREVEHRPMSFRPGTKQQYNNFNFAIAGQVIEGASGKPYLEFMREEVFKPLGMTRTGFGQHDSNTSPGHYLRKNGQYEGVADAKPKGGLYGIPSGFIQTTLTDLLHLYRGIQQHKLLTPERTREMISPVTPGKTGTPGWFTRVVNGVTIVAKNGAASGYSSQFQFVPGRGDGVIFVMNLQGQDLGTDSLAVELLREICGLPLPERRGAAEN
ncbi:MAG TPA: serine hydrolase domain-containing protein, partial [Pirellulales bacterium]|nr:serine hydrolase domain-containing protein [Pirellulales bacterium]